MDLQWDARAARVFCTGRSLEGEVNSIVTVAFQPSVSSSARVATALRHGDPRSSYLIRGDLLRVGMEVLAKKLSN